MIPTRFYNAKTMVWIAALYESVSYLIENFDTNYGEYANGSPLFIADFEIIIRHSDGYVVGRIFIEDDFPVFELLDEDYGKVDDVILPADGNVDARILAHIRQEDTASGQR